MPNGAVIVKVQFPTIFLNLDRLYQLPGLFDAQIDGIFAVSVVDLPRDE